MADVISAHGTRIEDSRDIEYTFVGVTGKIWGFTHCVWHIPSGVSMFAGLKHECEKMMYKIRTFVTNAEGTDEVFDIRNYHEEFPNSIKKEGNYATNAEPS